MRRLHGSATLVDVLQAVDCALTSIDLSDNNLGLEGAALLAEAIGKNGSLCHLSLRCNNFGEQGTKLLMDSLSVCASARLVSLDLGSGELGLDGLLLVAKELGRGHSGSEDLIAVRLREQQKKRSVVSATRVA
jgi:hypothetical protein